MISPRGETQPPPAGAARSWVPAAAVSVMQMGSSLSGEEHWAQKGSVSLFLWRKRAGGSGSGEGIKRPIILVHGSWLSALPTFDLDVPGHPGYSFMDWLAGLGHDVWTLDHEGYGRSTIADGNSDIAAGVDDLMAASEVIARVTGAEAFNVYGLSSGALRAAAFAAAAPHRVARVVLDAFVWTGKDSPALDKRREGMEFFRTPTVVPLIAISSLAFSPVTNPAPATQPSLTHVPMHNWRMPIPYQRVPTSI